MDDRNTTTDGREEEAERREENQVPSPPDLVNATQPQLSNQCPIGFTNTLL